ncbi:protein-glutamate O-methyltransferase CheR [Fulvivirga sp. 29W222]|uniref:Protein-glutamate O-methyltransferase CheR n=1 Tax=Fulvivirga marina TaxID=2494733 RepID=A0A937FZA7_9BACT|nr:protein-glutamate O-methyltransferase CheR [Fulvivirga marina]MBL6447105.1 protein-glutamate O-methyltransferase CheR [Fulvivirga marina]
MHRIEITDEELNSLTSAIMTRHGIDFTCYEPKSLKRRVSRALSIFKLNSVHDLWLKILNERDFVNPFINELSVGLTEMFRDPFFWQKLATLLPALIHEKGNINVWHAGCSSGEEVYTLSIILRELGLEGKVDALATDINTNAIQQAKKGKYHQMKFKDYNYNYLQYHNNGSGLSQYYSNDGLYRTMQQELVKHVIFEKNNLITDTIQQKFDIIFCRNVMIYFDIEAKKMVLEKLHNNLNPGGLLIIGFFDALIPIIDKARFQIFDLNNKIFKKA